jgi:hypothetical protein
MFYLEEIKIYSANTREKGISYLEYGHLVIDVELRMLLKLWLILVRVIW